MLLKTRELSYLYLPKILAPKLPYHVSYGIRNDLRGTEHHALSSRTDDRAARPNPFRALGARRLQRANAYPETSNSRIRITTEPRVGPQRSRHERPSVGSAVAVKHHRAAARSHPLFVVLAWRTHRLTPRTNFSRHHFSLSEGSVGAARV
jgi:hypothetical protein